MKNFEEIKKGLTTLINEISKYYDTDALSNNLVLLLEDTKRDISQRVDAGIILFNKLTAIINTTANNEKMLQEFKKHMEYNLEKIHENLYDFCNETVLVGSDMKLIPYRSANNTVDMKHVEPHLITYNISLPYEDYIKIKEFASENGILLDVSEKCTATTVKNANPKHPALIPDNKKRVKVSKISSEDILL